MTNTLVNKPITRAIKFKEDSQWLDILPSIDTSWTLMSQLLKEVSVKYPKADVLQKRKKYESAKEKTQRKDREYHQLGDLVKGTILTDNLQEAMVVVSFLINNFNVVKWEAFTGTLTNPYCGVIHVDIQLGNLVCELQITTRKNWTIKKESNHYNKTGRASEGAYLWIDADNFSDIQRGYLLGV